ncbi:hypothetical protein BKA65DRAFT_557543 [Rhexocercosporidium sp. MPI-PUGE-AT-0058]|nr:hypothetical protein BKA65DRAFT_557543 [Rhexocercosporidium sp. MPI-PUGE-AT-0058]
MNPDNREASNGRTRRVLNDPDHPKASSSTKTSRIDKSDSHRQERDQEEDQENESEPEQNTPNTPDGSQAEDNMLRKDKGLAKRSPAQRNPPEIKDSEYQISPRSSHGESPHLSQQSRHSRESQAVIEAQLREIKRLREINQNMTTRLQATEQQQLAEVPTTEGYFGSFPAMSGALPYPFMALQPARRGLSPSLRGPPVFPSPTPQSAPLYPTIGATPEHLVRSRDRPRAKAPSTFTPPKDDLRFWILEIEDYMVAEGIVDSSLQAATARDYVHTTIKKRIQYARLNGTPQEVAKYLHWLPLKKWLFSEYGIQTSAIEADIRMTKIRMFDNQSVQDFNNFFEGLLQDVSWCHEPLAVLANYRSKLTQPIFKRIYDACRGVLPITYPAMKEQALRAEEYLRTTSYLFDKPAPRAQSGQSAAPPRKNDCF